MIGPDPMIRTERQFKLRQPFVDNYPAVPGTWSAVGAELNGTDGKTSMPESFDRVVVEIAMRDHQVGGQG